MSLFTYPLETQDVHCHTQGPVLNDIDDSYQTLALYSFIYPYSVYYHQCETTPSPHRLDHIFGLVCTAFERALTAGDIFAEK